MAIPTRHETRGWKRSHWYITIVLLPAAFGRAQTTLGDPTPIQNLATDFHGSTLYFTTWLRQRGTNQSPISKVFALSGTGLQLIKQSSFYAIVPGAPIYTRPSVSGDGTVLAINWYPHYDCGSSCSLLEIPSNLIRMPAGETGYPGYANISPNGRFALLSGIVVGPPPGLPPPTVQSELLDLTSGKTTVVGPQPAGSGQVVANDGTVLVQNGSHVQLVGPGGTVSITPAAPIINVQLAADAGRIVYDTYAAIHVLDVSSGSDRQVALGYFPILAGDGQHFSYLNPNAGEVLSYYSANQVWLGDAVSGTVTQLTHEPEGIAEQVITGDGRTVFAATTTGRVLSIDVSSGTVTQLLDSAPSRFLTFASAVVPGSYNWLTGTSDTSLRVWIDGIPAIPLGAVLRTSEVMIQVPWEVQPDPSATIVFWGREPSWEQVVGSRVVAMAGRPITLDGNGDAAIHQDWSRLVSQNDPAHPGEIIHMYGTGWGPVDGTVTSGEPTPTDRLYSITAPCQWRAVNQANPFGGALTEYPFSILFGGLAPDLIGLYQFDFLIPSDWSYPIFNPICRTGSGASDFIPAAAVPVAP
jgi:uncharacterized protein (TIGR03437 family)